MGMMYKQPALVQGACLHPQHKPSPGNFISRPPCRALHDARFFYGITGNSKQQLRLCKEVTQRWLEANVGRGADHGPALTYREIFVSMIPSLLP